jgi:DNA modification methylase
MDKIFFGDCMDVMQDFEDNSIDFVLTDLPYGITAPKWDSRLNLEDLWSIYKRILKKDAVVVMFASQPFTTHLIRSNEKNFRYCWYWVKNQGTNFFHAKRMPIRKMEELVVFNKGKYNPQVSHGHIPTQSAKGCSEGKAYHGTNSRDTKGGKTTRYPTNILEFKCVDNYSRLHSAEKPVDLLRYMIRTYTDEGEVVLDNCMGVGSTVIACVRENRQYIGIENDKEIFGIAEDRIKNESIL